MLNSLPKIEVPRLGPAAIPSPLLAHYGPLVELCVPDTAYVIDPARFDAELLGEYRLFERAGPRAKLHFDPKKVRAGIVTCGGLCPGLNNIIRFVTNQLTHGYGVKDVLGFRYGYSGLNPALGHAPMELTSQSVEDLSHFGGTALGSSRGPQDAKIVVDYLESLGVNVLFCVGGDGTQRGAMRIDAEARRRESSISVVGIPKTIDNDVPFCSRSFGFLTAVEKAVENLVAAHEEARSSDRGVGLVKLMGRDAGFICAAATSASGVVNLTLIPELPFELEGPKGIVKFLEERMDNRNHVVIAVAEGAGQSLFENRAVNTDASGNKKFNDVGVLLRDRIVEHFAGIGKPISMKYIDPSYAIRGVPANSADALLCERYARHAVHAAMSGRTGMFVGYIHDEYIHVPMELATHYQRRIDLSGSVWNSVLASTGQPAELK
jgi:6-phosphofructokinase 1